MNTPIIYVGQRPPRLTHSNTKLMDYISAYKRDHDGQSPTIRQIMHALNYSSTSVVNYHIQQLVELGFLRKGKGARSLSVVDVDTITVQETATPRGTLVIADKRLQQGKRYEVVIREVSEE